MSEEVERGLEWITKGYASLKHDNEKQSELIRHLQGQVESLNGQVNQLSSLNKTLTTKYTNVLKSTKQLIQFRNSILGVMNTTQQGIAFPSLENLNDSQSNSAFNLEESIQQHQEYEIPPRPESNPPTPFTINSSPKSNSSSPSKIAHVQFTDQKSPLVPYSALSSRPPIHPNMATPLDSRTQSASPGNSSGKARVNTQNGMNVKLDAPTIYKQVRQALSNPDFESFAGVIAQFNASTLSIEEAMVRIKELVKNDILVIQMGVLMKTALEEQSM